MCTGNQRIMEDTMKDILARASEALKDGGGSTPETVQTPEPIVNGGEPVKPEPVEPTVVVEPTEPQTPEEPKSTLFDMLLSEEPVVPAVEPTTDAAAELAKKIEELNTLLAEKDTVLSKYEQNEYIKAIAKYADLENFDPKAFVKEVAGEDVSALPYSELLKRDLVNKYGLDGDALEKAVENKILEFDSKEDWEQIILTKDLVNSLSVNKKADSELLKSWDEAIKNKAPQMTQEQYIAKQQEALAKIVEEDAKAISEIKKAYVGQEIMGYQVTDEDMSAVEKRYDKYVGAYVNDKNEFEANKFLKEQTLLVLLPKLLNAAKEEGKKEALKGRTVSPDTTTPGVGSPLVNNDDPTTKFLKKNGLL